MIAGCFVAFGSTACGGSRPDVEAVREAVVAEELEQWSKPIPRVTALGPAGRAWIGSFRCAATRTWPVTCRTAPGRGLPDLDVRVAALEDGRPRYVEAPPRPGPPNRLDDAAPPAVAAAGDRAVAEYQRGARALGESGCLACHKMGSFGNDGPGPPLDGVGARLTSAEIARTLRNAIAPMPSFASLEDDEPRSFRALVAYLAAQR